MDSESDAFNESSPANVGRLNGGPSAFLRVPEYRHALKAPVNDTAL
jgi:hypothetical protein